MRTSVSPSKREKQKLKPQQSSSSVAVSLPAFSSTQYDVDLEAYPIPELPPACSLIIFELIGIININKSVPTLRLPSIAAFDALIRTT